MSDSKHLYLQEFGTYLFCALVKKGHTTLDFSDLRFAYALEQSARKLEELAGQEGINVMFRVRRDPIHSDSELARDIIAGGITRDIFSMDFPRCDTLRFKLTSTESDDLFQHSTGSPELYEQIASEFLRSHEAYRPEM